MLIIVAAIIAVVVLLEEVLPRLKTALHHRRHKAKADQPRATAAEAAKDEVAKDAVAKDAGEPNARPAPSSQPSPRESPAPQLEPQPAPQPLPSPQPQLAPLPQPQSAQPWFLYAPQPPQPEPPPPPSSADADTLWAEARAMPHNYVPDPQRDGEYLWRLYGAAKLGHAGAMAKIGDYAFRRQALVEAFYWKWKAQANGWDGKESPTLREIRKAWMLARYPTEYENVGDWFSEEQGVFARAVLRLQCGVNQAAARKRLQELAGRGQEDALLFGRMG